MGLLARKDQAYDIYSAESDLFLLSNPLEGERFIDCRAGDYMILFPSDIHRPAVADGCNKKYRKVVIKVKVSALREEN